MGTHRQHSSHEFRASKKLQDHNAKSNLFYYNAYKPCSLFTQHKTRGGLKHFLHFFSNVIKQSNKISALLRKGSLKHPYQLKCVHFSTAQANKNKDFEGEKNTVIYRLPKLMGPGHKESCSTAGASQVLMEELTHSMRA